MILDVIDNIDSYSRLNQDVFIGLQLLKTIDTNIDIGEYVISENIKMIVSEYTTKVENNEIYEAHKYVVDIQYPVIGSELVQWSTLKKMKPCTKYDIENDRTFFKSPYCKTDCIIGKGVFAIFFPEDAHNPQHAPGEFGEKIKKVTIKVKHSNV